MYEYAQSTVPPAFGEYEYSRAFGHVREETIVQDIDPKEKQKIKTQPRSRSDLCCAEKGPVDRRRQRR